MDRVTHMIDLFVFVLMRVYPMYNLCVPKT